MRNTHGIDRLQENVTENIECHGAARLDTAVPVGVVGRRENQVLFLNDELLVTDGNADIRKLVDGGGHRDEVALVLLVVLGSRDGLVESLADLVRDESERRSRVGDGRVSALGDLLSVDCRAAGVNRPEPLRVVNWSPVDVLTDFLRVSRSL
jgi:hypothetical protein